jgi:hypothetical protein
MFINKGAGLHLRFSRGAYAENCLPECAAVLSVSDEHLGSIFRTEKAGPAAILTGLLGPDNGGGMVLRNVALLLTDARHYISEVVVFEM